MVVDLDLLQSECLLVLLTGSLSASEVAAKRAKGYKRMANIISERKRTGNERINERRMEMKGIGEPRRASGETTPGTLGTRPGTSPSLTYRGTFDSRLPALPSIIT